MSTLACAALSGCESANEIGLEVLPGDVPAGAALVEVPGTALSTVADTDSVLTANRENLLVGRLTDVAVGTTTAETYAQVEPPVTTFDEPLPTTGIVDSLVLRLPYSAFSGSAYPNEPGRRLGLEVREVTEGIVADRAYYGDSPAPATGPLLGETTFTNRFSVTYNSRRVLVNRVRTGNPAVDTLTVKVTDGDTVRALQPLRFPLHRTAEGRALASRLYAAAGTSAYGSLAAFQNTLKGLAITPKAGSTGALVSLAPYNTAMQLVLYYRTSSDSTTVRTLTFEVGGDSRDLPRKRFFSRLSADFSVGADLRALTGITDSVPVTAPAYAAYIQSGVELSTRFYLPELRALRSLKGRVVVNRAELYVPLKAYATGVYGLPSVLYAAQIDSVGRPLTVDRQLRLIQNEGASQSGTSSAAPLIYDASQGAFRGLVTGWVQAYVDDRLPDRRVRGLELRSTLPTVLATAAAGTAARSLSVNRAVVDAVPGKLRLKIYYSTLQ